MTRSTTTPGRAESPQTSGSHGSTDPADGKRLPRMSSSQLARLRHGMGAYLGVGGLLILMVLFLRFTQDNFGKFSNFVLIMETNAVLLVLAVGMTFVVLTGGVDLSVGGVLLLTSMIFGRLVTEMNVSVWLAMPLVVLLGALLGLVVNGGLIAGLRLNFFVITIGTAYIFTNLGLLLTTSGSSIGLTKSSTIQALHDFKLGPIPLSVLVAVMVFLVGLLVLRYTGYGRMVYAVGGNPEAARLAGINVTAIRASVYGIASGCAALAGLMLAIRLQASSPNAATGIELTVAAAVFLGGTSFMGGVGSIFGTLLGTLFLGVLDNGLTLAGISSFWKGVATGVVLVFAMLVDLLRKSRRAGG